MVERGGQGGQGWQAGKYDDSHRVSRDHGEELLGLLSPEPGERVLDLGCGTGHFAARISDTGALVVGLDASPAMVERARSNYPGISFVEADATNLEAEADFDAVFSNSALHWMEEQEAAVGAVGRLLKPGGRFVGEFGAEGNLAGLVEAAEAEAEDRGLRLRSPWYFPGGEEYGSLLEAEGFEVESIETFVRETPLQGGEEGLGRWLDVFGGELVPGASKEERRGFFEGLEEMLRSSHFDGERWWIDYHRIRFLASKR